MTRLTQAVRYLICVGCIIPALLSMTAHASSLTLESAIEQAKTYDPWLDANLAERQLLLRDLTAQFHNLVAELEVIEERRTFYTQQLLPGIRKTADAATNAYRVDNGRFAEVVQIRIRELNAQLTLLSLEFEQARLHAALNYLMTTYNVNEEGTL